jgi:hypothetical protein
MGEDVKPWFKLLVAGWFAFAIWCSIDTFKPMLVAKSSAVGAAGRAGEECARRAGRPAGPSIDVGAVGGQSLRPCDSESVEVVGPVRN